MISIDFMESEVEMETREALPAHFLIKIDSFSLLEKRGIDKIYSNEFKSGEYKWKLVIYPNGHGTGKDGEGYVSIYLAITDTNALPSNWEVNASFSIFLFNHKSGHYSYSLGRARHFHSVKPEWGFMKFMSNKLFTDPLNGYLVDDKCIFGAEVFVNEKKPVIQCLSAKNVNTETFKLEFIIKEFSTLKDKWVSEEFTVGGHKWVIDVYPNGTGKEIGINLSVFLRHLVSNNCADSERVRPSFTFRIKDQKHGRKHHQKTVQQWFSAKESGDWGLRSFIELSSLNDTDKGFIVNDCCILEIELVVEFAVSTTISA